MAGPIGVLARIGAVVDPENFFQDIQIVGDIENVGGVLITEQDVEGSSPRGRANLTK